jgi:hypothetical protein
VQVRTVTRKQFTADFPTVTAPPSAPGLARIRARCDCTETETGQIRAGTGPHPRRDSPTSAPGLAHIRAGTRPHPRRDVPADRAGQVLDAIELFAAKSISALVEFFVSHWSSSSDKGVAAQAGAADAEALCKDQVQAHLSITKTIRERIKEQRRCAERASHC